MDSTNTDTIQRKKRRLRIKILVLSVVLVVLAGLILLTRYAVWVHLVNESLDSISDGKITKAREEARKALSLMSWLADNKSFALSLRLMGDVYACRRNFQQAEIYNAALLKFDKKTWGENSADYAGDLSDLALMKRKQQNFAESERLYKNVIEIYRSLPGHEAEAARNQALLAWVLFKQGKSAGALTEIENSDQILRKQFGESSFERLVGLVERSYIYKQSANPGEKPDLTAAYKLITEPKDLEKSSAQTVVVLTLLAQMLADQNQNERALKIYEIAESNCKSSVFAGGYNTFMADILESHARLLTKMGQSKQAEILKRHAAQIRNIQLS